MRSFRFEKPRTASAAFAASGRFLAGGTTLVDLMKLGVEQPPVLVDINSLPLSQIEPLPSGGFRIGALVRNSDLAFDAKIRAAYPVLSEAILAGASPQLRNMATTGGNLMQRTRCMYFRDTAYACNKREPGSGCAARDGVHRTHAILGTSDACFATHPSDMCVAMNVLDATIHLDGPHGPRVVPIGEFHRTPGQTPNIETVLAANEMITHVEIPAPIAGVRSTYLKLRDRASYEFALASAAIVLKIESGHVHYARVAMGGVGTRPWRSHEAEAALIGKPATRENFRRAAEAALSDAKPAKDNAFKIELATRCVTRALVTAATEARA